MPVLVSKDLWSASAVACFRAVSDVHECSGPHEMALLAMNGPSTSQESLHGSLVVLAIDLPTFWDIYRTVRPHYGPFTTVQCCD